MYVAAAGGAVTFKAGNWDVLNCPAGHEVINDRKLCVDAAGALGLSRPGYMNWLWMNSGSAGDDVKLCYFCESGTNVNANSF